MMDEGKEPLDGRVVIYDTDGYYMGVSLARSSPRGPGGDARDAPPHVWPVPGFHRRGRLVHRMLERLHVEVLSDHVVTEIEPARSEGQALFGDEQPTWDAGSIVLVTHRLSDGLYGEPGVTPTRSSARHHGPLPRR